MKNYTVIKHSFENKPTLYNQHQKQVCRLTRRALDKLLEKYILYIDQSWNTINQGQQYYKIAEKI